MLRNYRFTSSLRKYDHCLTIAPLTEHCESLKKGSWLSFIIPCESYLFWYGRSLYTDVVLFFFSFFWRTSACARVRRAREREEEKKNHPYPFALAVNKSPAVYLLSRALEGLWRENRGAVNRRVRTFSIQTVYLNKEKNLKTLSPNPRHITRSASFKTWRKQKKTNRQTIENKTSQYS